MIFIDVTFNYLNAQILHDYLKIVIGEKFIGVINKTGATVILSFSESLSPSENTIVSSIPSTTLASMQAVIDNNQNNQPSPVEDSFRTVAVSDNTIQTTTQNPNYAATGLQIVNLPVGTWLITYSCVVSATQNNRLVRTSLFVNGSRITETDCQRRIGSGGGLVSGLIGTGVDQGANTSSIVISVDSPSLIQLGWNTSNGTATMQQRQITAVKIGDAS